MILNHDLDIINNKIIKMLYVQPYTIISTYLPLTEV